MITRNDNVYTLVGDVSGSVGNGRVFIAIEKDGVVFDGSGKTIRGAGTGVAIAVHGRKDVTVKNVRIIDFGVGIEIRSIDFESNSTGSNNRILDNYLESKYWGISLDTDNGVISGNTIVWYQATQLSQKPTSTAYYSLAITPCFLITHSWTEVSFDTNLPPRTFFQATP